ncbi:MAG: ParB/RepB/Spo0J family partition protein [Actinomycetota bacterium]|nr:ParB/RepB/Spo0J family partition protein [Actinomycetota bacterium]MDK1016058.1 ParB/RepB/Spo0J family partition protein [Actinomycetota bacterium]MDK1039309.1 ParB/RepB/Spo0J family partition protein [Actinomycetota bacterium]MDK1096928.1 ParB/RepB/Spo0J family partition protein [Actinomycetota bacterium]MDK1102588.1 ParB/RepB/Spo0J family partition protein [Actinomycetota bacterium]
MAARKTGLGRGLEALIPQRPIAGYAEIAVDTIGPNPNQPRSGFDQDSIDSLAASIVAVGLLQPIVVRPEGEGYVLVAGERRLRAVKQVGLASIAAVIRSESDDGTNLTEALVENLQREDLNALEEAAAYKHLLEDFGITHDEIALKVGKSRSAVTNTLRLLQLPAPIQRMLIEGDLSQGHARALLGSDDEAYAVHIAQRSVAEGWTVRRVEEAIRLRASQGQTNSVRSKKIRPAAIIELEEKLQDRLGTKVRIDYRGRGGKITIKYASPEDLERIYRHLFEPGA